MLAMQSQDRTTENRLPPEHKKHGQIRIHMFPVLRSQVYWISFDTSFNNNNNYNGREPLEMNIDDKGKYKMRFCFKFRSLFFIKFFLFHICGIARSSQWIIVKIPLLICFAVQCLITFFLNKSIYVFPQLFFFCSFNSVCTSAILFFGLFHRVVIPIFLLFFTIFLCIYFCP